VHHEGADTRGLGFDEWPDSASACARGPQARKVSPSAKEVPMATRRSTDIPASPPARTDAPRPSARVRRSPTEPARLALTPEARRTMIAEGAYLRAERRGFAPGHETEDWLAAEEEVDALLKVAHGGSSQ
jgi:hypothetical protein